MAIKQLREYLQELQAQYQYGNATEMSYRPALQQLLTQLLTNITVTHEPKRISCGAPDYVLTKNTQPVGYIETKDLGKALDDNSDAAQFKRYRNALSRLVITNYLEFRFFIDGELTETLLLGVLDGDRIKANDKQFDAFVTTLTAWPSPRSHIITSAKKLAELMAAKARLLAESIKRALQQDTDADSKLRAELAAFRKELLHDIDEAAFADMYAQTITYGLFAARTYHSKNDHFSRHVAASLIPDSAPFLKRFFQFIASDLDKRLIWIVDDLSSAFAGSDFAAIMADFGSGDGGDPAIHFYETFLSAYNPGERKRRGVWYTPPAVVDFIVRAVDDVLQAHFGLAHGLADTAQLTDGRSRVQILDPATGTGTFLKAVIDRIHRHYVEQQQGGVWPSYAREQLLPRLFGFEIQMAPYTIAHIQLASALLASGVSLDDTQRLHVYLTNALEDYNKEDSRLPLARWLAEEANRANAVKRDAPVMVVLGNPPYSGHSMNNNDWINQLLAPYKKEPGGVDALQERNSKWLNNDYVKFLCFGERLVNKTGEGVLAFITENRFLDGPTYRGMRWHLLNTFDTIYIIDLHGYYKEAEGNTSISRDENVFDIKQGVAISVFMKNTAQTNNALAAVWHCDVFGTREYKYQWLAEHAIDTINWQKVVYDAPQYYFVPKDTRLHSEYTQGFSIHGLFPVHSVGIVTARDNLTIQHSKAQMWQTVNDFVALPAETARARYQLGEDVRDWQVHLAQQDISKHTPSMAYIKPIMYRPFDIRYTYYTGKTKGFLCMPREKVMRHLLQGKNIGLVLCKQLKYSEGYSHIFITNSIFESSLVSNKTSEIGYGAPLYLYPQHTNALFQNSADQLLRTPNLDKRIVQQFAAATTLRFTNEKHADDATFAPIDILDYCYAVLHHPTYRQKYREFLKTDFPRVPYPNDADHFRSLATLGGQLRQLHLFESPLLDDHTAISFNISGHNVIDRPPQYRNDQVFINDTQYFGNVPPVAWSFTIGGYQPAQKWLKDRRGQTLSGADITHYQKIIIALTQTDALMQRINAIDI